MANKKGNQSACARIYQPSRVIWESTDASAYAYDLIQELTDAEIMRAIKLTKAPYYDDSIYISPYSIYYDMIVALFLQIFNDSPEVKKVRASMFDYECICGYIYRIIQEYPNKWEEVKGGL